VAVHLSNIKNIDFSHKVYRVESWTITATEAIKRADMKLTTFYMLLKENELEHARDGGSLFYVRYTCEKV
jgi:hypothetical protein